MLFVSSSLHGPNNTQDVHVVSDYCKIQDLVIVDQNQAHRCRYVVIVHLLLQNLPVLAWKGHNGISESATSVTNIRQERRSMELFTHVASSVLAARVQLNS